LGTGSTSKFAVDMIGERFQRGELKEIIGVPTSEATRAQAESYGIPLAAIEQYAVIDLAIDGADEVDPVLDLIKGLGGALLREKAVELKAKRFLVVADESKLVDRLGTKAPVPVEVAKSGWRDMSDVLRAFGCVPSLRGGEDAPKITDGGNYVIDCRFERGIPDARKLARELDVLPGVLAHGLFIAMASEAIIAGAGGVRRIAR
jgi:ribose 5-phosphate isomerase A